MLYGYSVAFGNEFGFFGDPSQYFGLSGTSRGQCRRRGAGRSWAAGIEAVEAVTIPLAGTIPQSVFVAFQLMFAIITVALISGAVADRPQVRRLAGVRRAVGDVRLLPGGALGVRLRRDDWLRPAGWIANKLRGDRLRRWHRSYINAVSRRWCSR